MQSRSALWQQRTWRQAWQLSEASRRHPLMLPRCLDMAPSQTGCGTWLPLAAQAAHPASITAHPTFQ